MRRKPKPYIEAQLQMLLPAFTKLCGLERVPYLTFSKGEVKKLGLRRYSNLGNRYLGMAWCKENVIYVSPRHEKIESARHTLAHEFIHLRFRYSHGPRFEEKIKQLLAGQQFKPKAKKQ